MTPSAPLIVTLTLDPATFGAVDALRRQHFPLDRNHLSAHVTLFHHLPGDREADVAARLAVVCQSLAPMPLTLPSPRFLGRGVAIDIRCDGLARLHADLAGAWEAWLTPQDRQPLRPHVTVQNKVAPDAAKALFQHLRARWLPLTGTATGLQLFRYRGGPWEPAATFPFGAGPGEPCLLPAPDRQ